jgi:hypothetical protein
MSKRSMSTEESLREQSVFMDVMFSVTIASLFSGIRAYVGPVKVQLSDLLALITIFVTFLRGFATPRLSIVTLLSLFAYLLFYCISALFVQFSMGITKMVQLLCIFTWLLVVFGYYRTRSTDRLLIISAVLIVVVLAANVGWHIARGQYVAWKQLNEPKTIFILLPLILILLFDRFERSWRQPLPLVAVLLSAAIIFMSGERKAYIFGTVALLVWSGPLKMLRYGAAALLAVPILLLLVDGSSPGKAGYLQRQIASFEVLISGANTQQLTDSQLLDESRPTTMSNAEREYTNRHARALWWKQAPLFGIGTNEYELQMRNESSVPILFRMGIHGGFFRALYENGVFGLELYIAIWICAFSCALMSLPQARELGAMRFFTIKMLTLVMLLIYCSFESDKGLIYYATCMLPFVVGLAPPRLRYVPETLESRPVTYLPDRRGGYVGH